jgi:hypothetical protein
VTEAISDRLEDSDRLGSNFRPDAVAGEGGDVQEHVNTLGQPSVAILHAPKIIFLVVMFARGMQW